jgi:hypothetical protein
MDFSRFKKYDYGVMGLFVLTIIGVSLSWYSIALSFEGENLDGLGTSGWELSLGVLCFVVALAGLVWVGIKAFFTSRAGIPGWYKEGIVLMALGGLMTLFALIRIIDKPGGAGFFGVEVNYEAGLFVTFVAGLLLAGCGYLAHRDKSLASSQAVPAPMAGPGMAGPSGGAAGFCQDCGAPLDAGAKFCRACGKPQ